MFIITEANNNERMNALPGCGKSIFTQPWHIENAITKYSGFGKCFYWTSKILFYMTIPYSNTRNGKKVFTEIRKNILHWRHIVGGQETCASSDYPMEEIKIHSMLVKSCSPRDNETLYKKSPQTRNVNGQWFDNCGILGYLSQPSLQITSILNNMQVEKWKRKRGCLSWAHSL